uniref:MFS transporter n=1 Tax=Alteromonas stellipolaris TaxID=233316 RepID=UPI0035649648
MQVNQPRLSFWQIWNVSFGFLGVQFGFALQNANVSRILSDLGADLHSLSLFWLVAPIMGLIVQPIVGSASDRTWNRLGRRRPFILAGAVAAVLGMILLPNAPLFVAFLAPMLMGALMVALMDASFNVCFQPFRSLVSDMVPPSQRNIGYSIQSLLINIGAVIGSILPFVLTNVVGLENTAQMGEVAPSVIWAFYIGATVLLGTVIWTVFRTKEYSPEEYNRYKGLSAESNVEPENTPKAPFTVRMKEFFSLVVHMPKTMKQLAVVQFFSWFALFIMWVYTTPAITQHIWGVDKIWWDPAHIASVAQVPDAIAAAKGAAGDWVGILFAAYSVFAAVFSVFLARLADKFGRKTIY